MYDFQNVVSLKYSKIHFQTFKLFFYVQAAQLCHRLTWWRQLWGIPEFPTNHMNCLWSSSTQHLNESFDHFVPVRPSKWVILRKCKQVFHFASFHILYIQFKVSYKFIKHNTSFLIHLTYYGIAECSLNYIIPLNKSSTIGIFTVTNFHNN